MARSVDSVLGFCRCYAFPVLVFSYVLFILAGGAVFMVLEQPEEDLLVSEVRGLRAGFLQDHPCVEESSLDELVRTVLSAGRRGVSEEEDQDQEYNFDFTSSLFFVTTFLTTTGYGTTIPLSDEGRVFCMLYCLVGIPLTLLLLSCLTHALLPRVTHAPIRHLQLYCGLSHNRAALLYCGVLAVCTATLFFLLPAAALSLLERDWSFLESLYYCFISLSTIGLGDYLPGRTQSQAVRQGLEFATSCYLVLGLIVLLVVAESFWQLQQVQDLVRLFVGPRVSELMGVGLDELTRDSGAQISPMEPRYTLPISTISHPIPAASSPVEGTFTLGKPRMASYEKAVSATVHPEPPIDPPDQND
ncbi:potassium channel, subfamily K, member 7 [Astyanax mexicanus]|uniref:potassium channel, subfamily K, member 7 n=1 Tax=Astyanax mexicanus TaxID=7994 RepID=UPI0020CAD17A|nr:potassium channel, subfamily K, member 7 [Astyanax mexicanus]